MKKNLLITLVGLTVLAAGCVQDKSSEIRQVSTPNPPVKSMTAPPGAPNGQNMPEEAKKMIGSVAPGAAGK